jgi:hypothetical protein
MVKIHTIARLLACLALMSFGIPAQTRAGRGLTGGCARTEVSLMFLVAQWGFPEIDHATARTYSLTSGNHTNVRRARSWPSASSRHDIEAPPAWLHRSSK